MKNIPIFATVSISKKTDVGKYSLYKLVLKDLELGTTEYKYELDNSFFKLINDEESDINRGKLTVSLVVKRTSSMFELGFDTKGQIQVPCDRCLDDVNMEVDTQNKLVVKFGTEYSEESDEIVVIPEDEGELNIAWFLYEFITLSLPMKHVHPAGMCNKTVSSKLKKHKAVDLNDEDNEDEGFDSDADGGDEEPDPRWDALKDLERE